MAKTKHNRRDFSKKFALSEKVLTFALPHRGVEQSVARRAHNPEVGGSSPPPATKQASRFRLAFCLVLVCGSASIAFSVNCNYICVSPPRIVFGGGEMVYNQLVTLMKKFLCLLFVPLAVLAVSCKKEESNNDKIPVPEAIDLGITVDGKTVKWASFNIGASKPWEYGNYYAWGECEPKADYSQKTYAYTNGAYDKITKYCPKDQTNYWDMTAKPEGPDGITTLYPSDDVAHVKLGGKWRMPTPDEIDALLALKENADYTWEPWVYATDENGNEAKDANGNIIYGLRITRISNNAVLFLPAAGIYYDDSGINVYAEYGWYWTSSLSNPSQASYLSFSSDDSRKNSNNRYYGLPVRPVCVE